MAKRILITGATGMIGNLILNYCLKDKNVEEVITIVRKPSTPAHPKIRELVLNDFGNYSTIEHHLKDIDIIYFCLGVYTGAVSRALFRTITIDYPMALVKALGKEKSNVVFCLLSGQGADRSEKSQLMFAKDKGCVENLLSKSGLKSFYAFRPGYIYPVEPRVEPNFTYRVMRFFYPVVKLLGPYFSITSTQLAEAMYLTGMDGWTKEVIENHEIIGMRKII